MISRSRSLIGTVLWYQLIEHAYQLIEHAKTSRLPVILVTDDLKEDWWSFAGDRRIGPRPELRHEFQTKTECEIYIYSSDTFVENAKNRGKKLSESAAEEIESSSLERQQDATNTRIMMQLLPGQLTHDFRRQQEMLDQLKRDYLGSSWKDELRGQKNAL